MSRSIQQLPNNSGTASTTEVYTATGFNAGDPVYFQNGDYKNPANLTPPSSLSFNFVENAAINPNGTGGIISPAFSYAQMQTGFAGGSVRKFAAVLTNGNIVQVFANYKVAPSNAGRPYFRIVNSSGTVVVSPTLISSTYYSNNYSNIAVVALTGGGFAVAWVNDAGGTLYAVNYAIYNNSGTVVTAATQDTSFSLANSAYGLEMTSLANGGFAVAAKANTSVIYLRAYGSTGTGAYSTLSTSITGANSESSFAIAARSDSSVFICDKLSGTQYAYVLYDSTGTAILTPQTFTINSVSYNNGGPSASVLTDGTTIVIAFYGGSGSYFYPAFRFLPTGNTLSAETIAIPVANAFYRTNYAGNYIGVTVLSSNVIVLMFSDKYGNMQYAFYDSTGTCISGTNSAGAIPLQVPGGYCASSNSITFIESSGYISAYWTNARPDQRAVNQYTLKLNTSTYVPIPVSSITGSTYTLSGQTTGAQVTSTVNPNSVSYYTPSTTVNVVTNTPTTVLTTQIAAVSIDALSNCALPNGNFVVLYRSSYAITANVYSPSGGLLTSIPVGNGYATGAVYTAEVCALSGGGFVVAYLSDSSTITLVVYSSSYTASTSGSFICGGVGGNQNIDLAGLQDNKFVIVYYQGAGYAGVSVYNSALTILNTFNGGTYTIDSSFTVASNSYGGFAWGGYSSSYGSSFSYTYAPTATNTWAEINGVQHSASSGAISNPQMVATPCGTYAVTICYSAIPRYAMFSDPGSAEVVASAALSSWPLGSANNPGSYGMMAIGLTGNGNVVIATSYDAQNLGIACLPAQMTYATGASLPYYTTSAASPLMFSKNAYTMENTVLGNNSWVHICPLAGNNFVVCYRNTSGYPSFSIIRGISFSNTYTVTGNSTPSALVPITSSPYTTTNINGVLAGVALTNASAGSTGQLAINGQVQLGSSYTSTATGAFDHTGQAVSGVKGTFNGRSVNLQGNS